MGRCVMNFVPLSFNLFRSQLLKFKFLIIAWKSLFSFQNNQKFPPSIDKLNETVWQI